MKQKTKIKILIDIIMTLFLLFLMGYQFWDGALHEWAGAVMFVLFIAHHLLNFNWYKTLFKGKYTLSRSFRLVVDIAVFVSMLMLMYSGIVLSRHVFAFLPINGGMALARRLHILGSYWGFVLMSLHLGMHWNMMIGMVKKHIKKSSGQIGKIVFPIVGSVIFVYGLFVFFRRDFLSYMLLQNEFVFMDFNESKLIFYLEYLAMMGSFNFASHYLSRLFQWLGKRKKEGRKL